MNRRMPIASDVAELVGDYGERIENRSLLLEKFAVPKEWLDFAKGDDLNRASLLRICEGGDALIAKEAQQAKANVRRWSDGRDAKRLDVAKLNADILPRLVRTKEDDPSVVNLRAAHSRRLMDLFRRSRRDHSICFSARLEAPLAINLAEGLIQNAGMALDRLFGLPFIPGSALKGCARHAAIAEIKAESDPARKQALIDRFITVFGCATNDFDSKGLLRRLGHQGEKRDFRGAVTFLPAYPVDEVRIAVDVVTVHTPFYYTGNKGRRPGERDIPKGSAAGLREEQLRPNYFPVVKAGGAFGFILALSPNHQDKAHAGDLLNSARHWLESALTLHGIGAKTAAGYGWFRLDPELDQRLAEEEAAEQEKARAEARRAAEAAAHEEAERKRQESLSPEDRAKESFTHLEDQDFAAAVNNLASLEAVEQKALLLVLRDSRRDRLKRWSKSKKPSDQKRVGLIEQFAAQHGIKL
ncbi:MAG: type III-B CRISPR module RAMP protein Cmr6 [Puniceicoccaceae bacterium]|nr:MAG: type III-B CRISPR module RAMP protein Cmr6 [Puniceicoccaceae bacterium]